ncbi:MAG: PD-(D/E)XK nuclease family transposase [Spirochaetales bacterium]|nr:PD-(D/E)XK nuclease family transposase [Spirochaetales bacterium]
MKSYIPAWSDIFILYLWGTEENKDLLLSFINTVLEDADFETIQSIDIQNAFNLKNFDIDKKTILDIKARDKHGRIYDIEVQSSGDRHFVNRSLYYWARLYSSQLTEGKIYTQLRPTICINILNFEIFEETRKAHSCFLLFEKDNPELALSDHLQLHFIELPKLKKSENMTKLERWLSFLLNEGKEESIMKFLIKDDPDIAKAHKIYNYFTQDENMRAAYEARQKWLNDYNSAIAAAEEKGITKGKEEGKEEGKVLIARKMMDLGMPLDQIALFTGFSLDRLKEIAKQE